MFGFTEITLTKIQIFERKLPIAIGKKISSKGSEKKEFLDSFPFENLVFTFDKKKLIDAKKECGIKGYSSISLFFLLSTTDQHFNELPRHIQKDSINALNLTVSDSGCCARLSIHDGFCKPFMLELSVDDFLES